jgi:hypothetical protein
MWLSSPSVFIFEGQRDCYARRRQLKQLFIHSSPSYGHA